MKAGIFGILSLGAWIDWNEKRIPDRIPLIIAVVAALSILIFPEISIKQRVAGSLIISIPLLLLACTVQGSIGGGDIKLMAAGGLLLGKQLIWKAFVIGIVSAGIYVIILLMLKRIDRKSEIALGPFLCFGIGILFIGI